MARSLGTVRLVNRSRAEAFWTCRSSDPHKEKVNSFGFVVVLSLGKRDIQGVTQLFKNYLNSVLSNFDFKNTFRLSQLQREVRRGGERKGEAKKGRGAGQRPDRGRTRSGWVQGHPWQVLRPQ